MDIDAELTPYEAWRKNGIDELQTHLNVLETVQTSQETKDACDKLDQLLDKLIKERERLRSEC